MAVFLQPPLLVYVIILVPAETPVTSPVLVTVATVVVVEVHGLVVAAVPEPASWVVDTAHTVSVPLIVGTALTVTVAVDLHPLLLVNVITLVPAFTPVTKPMLLTVATVVVEEVHGLVVAVVPDPVSRVVEPAHTVRVPVIDGAAFIVTVVLTLFLHPFVLVAVIYTIVTVPAATPVTTPEALTVAIAGVALLQAPPVVVSVSVVVLPTHTLFVPPIAAGADGSA